MESSDTQNIVKNRPSGLWIYYVYLFLIIGFAIGHLSIRGYEKTSGVSPISEEISSGTEGNINPGDRKMDTKNTSKPGIGIPPKSIKSYKIDTLWDFPFLHPRALAIDSNDNVYVGESYQGSGTHARILKFSSSGGLLGWWGKGNKTSGWHDASSDETPAGNGDGPGEFNYIFKITFDSVGNMYVINRGKYYSETGDMFDVFPDRIDQYDSNGNFRGSFYGGMGNGWALEPKGKNDFSKSDNSLLDEPSCIILDGENMIIGNWNTHRIDVYDAPSGKLLKWLGKNQEGTYGWHTEDTKAIPAPFFGTEIGAFNGIIDCNLYGDRLDIVSYNSNPVVAEYNLAEGTYTRGLSHNDGHKPQEIIEDAHGNLIMSDNYEGSIKFFDQDHRLITKLQLGPGGDYFGVGDFAFNSLGKLYFIEQQKEKLYVLNLEYGQ